MPELLWADSEWTFDRIKKTWDEIEKIGVGDMGIDIYRNQFEIISSDQMLSAYSSIGLPIYYNHWSFGKHFAQEHQSYKTGQSGLAYELVINSDPCVNYLMEENTMTTQSLVMAHAGIGHNSFFKNNYLFQQWTDASSIVDYMIFAKDYVEKCEMREGRYAVEGFLDSAHALMNYGVNRYKRPAKLSLIKEQERQKEREAYLQTRVDEFYRILPTEKSDDVIKWIDFPESPEENILYFCEKYSPFLEPWQRELIRIVRKVAQYFYPQGQTKVANEGFASWTHYTIMNRLWEKGLIDDGAQLEWMALHSNVLFQPNWYDRRYSGINPYKLGFEILRDVERICSNPTEEDMEWFPALKGAVALDVIKDIVANYRDESMVRQYLSPAVMRKMKLFHIYDDREDDENYLVKAIQNERGYHQVREALADSYERENHVPKIEVEYLDPVDRILQLKWTPYRDRLLDDPSRMLGHVERLWGHTVEMHIHNG